MPHGLVRVQDQGDLHFVTFSCDQRLPYLGTAAARDCFVNALERIHCKHSVCVVGYVVMPEHVHLLMSEPPGGSLARALAGLKISVAKLRPESPFWTVRYHDFNVYRRDKVVEKLRYMHRNPVERGLSFSPEYWRWSSYRDYLMDEPGPVVVDRSYVFPSVPDVSDPGVAARHVGAPPLRS